MRHVLRTLADARLVTIGEGTVEVAHEALIRHWPTLREWLDEDREGRLLHRRLTEAAQEWEALGRDPGALLRGDASGHDRRLGDSTRSRAEPARAGVSDCEPPGEPGRSRTSATREPTPARAVGGSRRAAGSCSGCRGCRTRPAKSCPGRAEPCRGAGAPFRRRASRDPRARGAEAGSVPPPRGGGLQARGPTGDTG